MGYQLSGSANCFWQGIATNAFPMASTFWTIIVSWMLFSIIKWGKKLVVTWQMHAVCWGLSITLAMLPFVNATYGSPEADGYWCFTVSTSFTPEWAVKFWYWFGFYAWIWLGIFFNLFIYVLVFIEFRGISVETLKRVKKILIKLLGYPFIVIFSWVLCCIRDTTYIFEVPIHPSSMINMIGNFFAVSQGFFTGVYFLCVNMDVVQDFAFAARYGRVLKPSEISIISRESKRSMHLAEHLAKSSMVASSTLLDGKL